MAWRFCMRRLQAAIDAAALPRSGSNLSGLSLQDSGCTPQQQQQEGSRSLRPLTIAIEMVFGSAAAISAAFGSRVRPLRIIAWASWTAPLINL
jgi:hypothetical protein